MPPGRIREGVLDKVTLPVTTTGGAGAATGSAMATLTGAIVNIALDFNAAPATTDTTIAYGGVGGGNILVVTNSATDNVYAPRRTGIVDNGNAAITGSYDLFVVNGPITVSLAQCDALSPAVTAVILYLR